MCIRDRDHTDLLGETIKEIALEKSGIIKRDSVAIIGEKINLTVKIFKKIAKDLQQICFHFIQVILDISLSEVVI